MDAYVEPLEGNLNLPIQDLKHVGTSGSSA